MRPFGARLLEKLAALNADVKLYPHQQRVVNDNKTSEILAHGVGSGKTVTSIAKAEKLKEQGKAGKVLVVTPAGLRDNYGAKGVGKFTDQKYNIVGNKQEVASHQYKNLDPDADYNIISYEMYRQNPKKYIKESGADTVITDEAHKGKNENTITTKQLKSARPLYKNHIALTGSLVSNSISDVQPLIDLTTNGHHNFGKTKGEFDQKWLRRDNSRKYRDVAEKRRPVVGFNHQGKALRQLSDVIDYVDYDDVKDLADMPGKRISVKKIPLSKEQAKIYKGILKNDKATRKMITKKRLETLTDKEQAMAFNKMREARKLMNSVGSVKPGIKLSESAEITPKTRAMLDDLDAHLKANPKNSAVLFSHLINGGVDVMEAGLKNRNIPYGKFIGKGNPDITEETRVNDVNDYNAGKKRVMIVSPAGAEGISLNDTTWEGVLDPHYNPEVMNQMEARGVRSGGLKGREDRNVDINRYLATMPKRFGIFKDKRKTPDEVIYEISRKKALQNQVLYDALKKAR